MTTPCRILWTGNLTPEQLSTEWQPDPKVVSGDLAAAIDAEWQVLRQAGYFNGALARLDRWQGDAQHLRLWLRPSDYKTLLYSNRHVAEIASTWGEEQLSRALGISAVVACRDQQLLLMKRSQQVGEFPGAFDVFGGHIDVADGGGAANVFAAIARELEEEACLVPGAYDIAAIGLLETCAARKPELVFAVHCPLDSTQLLAEARQAADKMEYEHLFTLARRTEAIDAFLQAHHGTISPSAYGCLQIYRDYMKADSEGTIHAE